MTIVSAPALLIGTEIVGPGAVVVRDGVVSEVLDFIPAPSIDHTQLNSGVLTPGMVDLQVNGCFGIDFSDASREAWTTARRALLRTGVTSFVPTLITAPIADLSRQLDDVRREQDRHVPGGAEVLGAHLEGPFLSPLRAGAHDASQFVDPTPARLDQMLSPDHQRTIRMVTLAPERSGALEAVRRLSELGIIVAVGHSDATAEQVTEAADAGASMITHLFNAQSGLHHREPGVAGTGLADERFRLGLIADLHHVAGPVLKITFDAAADRVVLVTDAVAAMGMPPGTSTLGGSPAFVDAEEEPPRRADGVLAGSALTLDQAVRNMVDLGITPQNALVAATSTPADTISRTDLGRIAAGAAADLIWWDDSFSVREVWLAGTPVNLP